VVEQFRKKINSFSSGTLATLPLSPSLQAFLATSTTLYLA